jgi:hypothetical protein
MLFRHLGRMHVDQLALRGRHRHRRPGLFKPFNMKHDGFLNQRNDFVTCLGGGNTSRQIRDIGTVAILTFFYDYQIFHGHYFSPACFRMLLSVPTGTSIPGFPDTVTVPNFLGCLN